MGKCANNIMATWAHIRTLTGIFPRWLCSDGTTLYFGSDDANNNSILSYVPATDTLTTIISSADVFNEFKGLTFFKGDLYCLLKDENLVSVDVLRYDGTPESTTIVKSMPFNVLVGDYSGIMSDANEMVVFRTQAAQPLESVTYYTANGTSWNAGSFAVNPNIPTNFINTSWSFATEWPNGFYVNFCRSGGGSCTNGTIEQWNTGAKQWQAITTGYTQGFKLSDPANLQHWTNGNGEYTVDFLTFFAPDADQVPNFQVNMPFTTSLDSDSSNLYEWSGVSWSLRDTLAPTFLFTGDFNAFIVRMGNLTPYMITREYNIYGGSFIVLESDETIGTASGFQHSAGGIPGSLI